MKRCIRAMVRRKSRAAHTVLMAVVSLLAIITVAIASLEAHSDLRNEPAMSSAIHLAPVPPHECATPLGSNSAHCPLPAAVAVDDNVGVRRPTRLVGTRWKSVGRSDRAQHRPNEALRPPIAISDLA